MTESTTEALRNLRRMAEANRRLEELTESEPILKEVKGYADFRGIPSVDWHILALVHLCDALYSSRKESERLQRQVERLMTKGDGRVPRS